MEGNVVHVPEGWISHFAVLDPAQVVEIAKDLTVISPGQVRAKLTATRTFEFRDDPDKEFQYVIHYLRDAVAFTTGLSERGTEVDRRPGALRRKVKSTASVPEAAHPSTRIKPQLTRLDDPQREAITLTRPFAGFFCLDCAEI